MIESEAGGQPMIGYFISEILIKKKYYLKYYLKRFIAILELVIFKKYLIIIN